MTDVSLADADPLRGARTLFAAALPAAASSVSRGDPTAIVVKLLRDAGMVLDTDRQAAKACIMRASALLQAADDQRAGDTSLARPTAARGGLAPWQIRRVLGHIEANLAARIRLHELAGIARLSTSHFARGFKASIGQSVQAHVSRRRIARAQELMLTTDESLSQIALTCGLADQSHLCRRFRAVVGATPTAWRRQWPVARANDA